jgi:hypothetical protein
MTLLPPSMHMRRANLSFDPTPWHCCCNEKRDQQSSMEPQMCLTCGCMDAHLEMGSKNITCEHLRAAAEENGRSVAETLDVWQQTIAKDRGEHADEYSAAG